MGKDKGVVHVVGTGTIGEPLIALLCSFKDQAAFSEVTFHKRSPLPRDLPKLKALIARGANLCVDEDTEKGFAALSNPEHLEVSPKAIVACLVAPFRGRDI